MQLKMKIKETLLSPKIGRLGLICGGLPEDVLSGNLGSVNEDVKR